MKRVYDETCRVLANRRIVNDIWMLKIHCPQIAATILPGQFVMLKVGAASDPLLRRPLTVARIDREEGAISILYRAVGRGTELMTRWEPGHSSSVLGPLGNGFTLPERVKGIALLGRDIGIGPLLALVEEGLARGAAVYAFLSSRYREVLELAAFAGGNCKTWLFPDGDRWQCGPFLTRKLEEIAAEKALDRIYIGGLCKFCPSCNLIRETHRLGTRWGIEVQVSLDQYMACGLGACQGCIVELFEDESQVAKVYRRVCKEGPVFRTWEVVKNG
ncbi:MAG TPA: dihydroorotate dehydrogenase electron transfer subunit [Firmicutes bacterium]|nr:dihydroorotate dehydrogenase electron transfer subunit [Bacillota bacterium]